MKVEVATNRGPCWFVNQFRTFSYTQNVDNADGTLAIRLHESSGTDNTIGYAQNKKWGYGRRGQTQETGGYKPVLVIHSLDTSQLENNVRLYPPSNALLKLHFEKDFTFNILLNRSHMNATCNTMSRVSPSSYVTYLFTL